MLSIHNGGLNNYVIFPRNRERSIEAIVATDSQRDSDNTKRPKPKENQLGILKIYAFCQKIQQIATSPGESDAGVMYISMRIHPKCCYIFPLKIETTYLTSGSRKRAIGA